MFQKYNALQMIAMVNAALALLLVFCRPSFASAGGVEIGITGGYNFWNPAWNNGKIMIYPPDMLKWEDRFAPRYPVITYFSFGPDVSVQFLRRWEFSGSFRYGTMSTGGKGPAIMPDPLLRDFEFTIKNYDVHGSISMYFRDWIKAFAGMRAEIIDYSVEYSHIEISLPSDFFRTTMEGRSLHFTPEIGLGTILQITPIFGINASIAGTFQSGSSKSEYKNSYSLKQLELGMQRIPTARYYALGMNTCLTFRFTIPRIKTTISLAGYYRLLRYVQKTSEQGIHVLDGSFDHLAGFCATVSYRFSFGERTSRRVWIPRPYYDPMPR
jgi:hypothetical protein